MKLRKIVKDKRGGYADIFIFMITAFVLVVVCVALIYMRTEITNQMHESLDNLSDDMGKHTNFSKSIDDTMGQVGIAYNSLIWVSVLLILGMIVAIFMGSYLVQTRPVYFIPYIILVFIAVIVSVSIANAYDEIRSDATLSSTFDAFTGSNFILLNLPVWVTTVGIVGGIIMAVRLNRGETYYG